MNRFQLVALFSIVSVVRGDLSVLQSNALLITIILSVIACTVPMLCFCVIIGLVVKITKMRAKLRAYRHPVFEEYNYNLSLTEGSNKDYKRLSNVYESVDTDTDKKSDSSDSINSNTPNEMLSKEESYITGAVQEERDIQQTLKLSLPLDVGNENNEDDSIYVVMTSPRNNEGLEETVQAFD